MIEIAMAQKKIGVAYTINPSKENLHEKLQEYTNNDGSDVIIEAVGSPANLLKPVEESAFTGR